MGWRSFARAGWHSIKELYVRELDNDCLQAIVKAGLNLERFRMTFNSELNVDMQTVTLITNFVWMVSERAYLSSKKLNG